jgi:signal transduction histidine kinase/phage shock protein PspC (stress-responsive transcriptional regulator)
MNVMSSPATTELRWPAVRVARAERGRVVAGVCAGWAQRYSVDPYVLRLALIVLTLPAGLGAVVYAAAWLLSVPPTPAASPPTRPPSASQRVLVSRSMGVACATGSVLLLCRGVGVWPGDTVMVPVVGMAIGAGLLWFQGRDEPRSANPLSRAMAPSATQARAAFGVFLTLAGVVALVVRGVDLRSLPAALAAIATVLAGVALLGGPYIAGLTAQLRAEERARIRVEERSEMAAQLHDSVLQTLALMQRSASDPRRMVTLARRQERQLRNWLYGAATPSGSLSASIEAVGNEVEDDHQVRVESVVVGDASPTPAVDALIGAIREAVVNAAKHSGCDTVSVFVEVRADLVVAFIRDTGKGFEPALVPATGHGIAASIRERLDRVGGSATLSASPGDGTEWELSVPISGARRP